MRDIAPTNIIFQKILTILTSWTGYSHIVEAMDQFPNMNIYLAGGAVRNVILCRKEKPKDFDFFIRGESYLLAVEKITKHGRILRGPFGSPRWFPESSAAQYCDLVSIARVDHGLGPCRDITDVLRQFDFTGNAIAVDLRTGEIFDPVNGVLDLNSRIMRGVRFDFPSEPIAPGQTLTRPAAQWFRILHYSAKLNLNIEPLTCRWLLENQHYFREYEAFVASYFTPHPQILDVFSKIAQP